MFKVLGIKFKLNILFLIVLFLFAISGLFLRASVTFIVVTLHELAHSLSAKRQGIKVNEIELLPFGGVAKFRDLIQLKPKSEIKIALAGPILNLFLAALTLLLIRYNLLQMTKGIFFIKINLIIGLFNLIPALPLDGGRVLRAKLAAKYGFKEATYKALRLSKLAAIILAIIAVIGIYLDHVNVMLLFIAFFIYFATLKESRYAAYVLMQYIAKKKGALLQEKVINVEQLITVGDVPIKEIVDKLVPNHFHIILVIDDKFKILGSVMEDKLIESLLNGELEVPIKNLL